MGLLDFSNVCASGGIKNSGSQDQDEGVHKKGKVQGNGTVNEIELEYPFDTGMIPFDFSGLNKG
jgi:hypothetical protein